MDPLTMAVIGSAIAGYLGSREQAKAARAAAQPLPTYYQHVMTPQQEALWSGLGGGMGGGLLSNMMMGQMPQAQAAGGYRRTLYAGYGHT